MAIKTKPFSLELLEKLAKKGRAVKLIQRNGSSFKYVTHKPVGDTTLDVCITTTDKQETRRVGGHYLPRGKGRHEFDYVSLEWEKPPKTKDKVTMPTRAVITSTTLKIHSCDTDNKALIGSMVGCPVVGLNTTKNDDGEICYIVKLRDNTYQTVHHSLVNVGEPSNA